MTQDKRFIATVAATFVLGAPAAFAILIPSEPVRLGARDRAAVLERACGRAGTPQDEIDAWRYLHETKEVYVHVTCAPHGVVASLPALKIADCNNLEGRWNCDRVSPAVRMRLTTGDVVLGYAAGVPPEFAIEVATYASTVRSFNGRTVPAFPTGTCSISDGKSAPFEGAINFNLICDGYAASITRDCWEKKCRLFFTAFDEIMVRRSPGDSGESTRGA